MKKLLVACCAVAFAAASMTAIAAEKKPHRKAARKVEHLSCTLGTEDRQARIAVEVVNGAVQNFAYYSKWKPRTCSLDFARNASGTKWRLTPDGATRVHTPQGRFLIRTRADAYVFEFEQVQRQKFCGMSGQINGSMTVKRGTGKPECSVVGIMDANDKYLDSLHKLK